MNTRFSSLAALVVTFASFALGGCAADGEPTSGEGEASAEQTSERPNDVATSERPNAFAPSERANDVATSERPNPTSGEHAGFAKGDSFEESGAVGMVKGAMRTINVGPLPPEGIVWGYYYCDASGHVMKSGSYTPNAPGWLYTTDNRSPGGTCCVQSLIHMGCVETL